MKQRVRACLAGWSLAMLALVPLVGCAKGFYISESDSRALKIVLNSGVSANELLGDLPNGQNRASSIQVTFDNSSGTPRINNRGYLVTAIRGLGDLQTFQENQGQLNVDRLATQLEDQLDQWVSDRVVLLADAAGSQVKITRLDSVSARFGRNPFNAVYDAGQSRISFSATAQVTIQCSINVNVLSGIEAAIASPFGQNPNGDYDLTITLSEMPINGWLAFSNPFSDAAQVQLHIDAPSAAGSMAISVSGTDRSQIVNGITALFRSQLSSPVDTRTLLRFDNFSLSDLKIDSSSSLGFVYHPLPYSVEPVAHVAARQLDGNLYYARKRSGLWGEFAALPLPGPVAGDPVLVASGSGQLELAVISSSGSLYYLAWRDGAWVNGFTSQLPQPQRALPTNGRPPKGRPPTRSYDATSHLVLIATAPGQNEIVSLDMGGQLWHLRRVNGVWQPPAPVPHQTDSATLPIRDPVAVWLGNQMELFYVDSQNRLFAQAFSLDTATWGNQFSIPTQGVKFAPTIAACGDGRIDLVYVRDNGDPFHNILNLNSSGNLSFGTEAPISGNLNAGPALVCSGYQQLELIGRGNDDKFYYNHFVGPASPQGLIAGRQVQPGWQGWVQQNSAVTAFPFYMGNIGPRVAVASTRDGDVELIALPDGTGDLPLLENQFPSWRFGQSDWKAVEWRGFQLINSGVNFRPPTFVGYPALTLTDRGLEIGTANHDATWHAAVTADHGGLIQGNPVAGSLLSTGPGALHSLTVDAVSGSILDRCFANFTQLPVRALPGTGSPITSFAATVNGGGEVDVVGAGQDESLYHWRYLNGHWLNPTLVPFTVTVPATTVHTRPGKPHSAPHKPPVNPAATKVVAGKIVSPAILAETGLGQLELLANGGATDYGEHDLYRWRFAGGSWTSAQQISTAFSVSTKRFSSSMASSWGDGTLDLVLVNDVTGEMLNTRLLPSIPQNQLVLSAGVPSDPRNGALITWPLLTTGLVSDRRFINIGGNTISAPALIAYGPTRLQLLAIGTDGYLYDNRTQSTMFQRGTTRGTNTATVAGTLNLPQWGWTGFYPLTNTRVSLGAAVKISDRESAVAVTPMNGSVLVNFFQGWRWADFFQVTTPAAGSASSAPPTAVAVH